MKTSSIALIVFLAIIFGIMFIISSFSFVSVASNFNVFENITSNIFNQYNVSNEMRSLYWNRIVEPVKGMMNFVFYMLFLTLIICVLVILVEVFARRL
jgi:hypothetical protein